MSPLAFASAATFVSSAPPAKDSFNKPQSPLGSAAVMAIPAIIGLFKSSDHSSFAKLVLSAIDLPPDIYPGCYRSKRQRAQMIGFSKITAAQSALSRPRKRHFTDQARESVSSFPRSSSIAGFAMPSTPGVANTLSHIWLIVGVAAAIDLASAPFPSGVSFVAKLLTSFNCAVAS